MISHRRARGTPVTARQEVGRSHNSVPLCRRTLACVLEIQDRALGLVVRDHFVIYRRLHPGHIPGAVQLFDAFRQGYRDRAGRRGNA